MRGSRGIRLALAAAAALALAPVLSAGAGAPTLGHFTDDVLGDHLGLDDRQIGQVQDTSWRFEADAFQMYRFADDASSPPTLTDEDVPYATPIQLGGHFMAWDDPDSIPQFPSDGFEQPNGQILLGSNGGIQPATPYLVAHAVFPSDIPIQETMEFHLNYSITLSVPGFEVWEPAPQFPFDTWGGASHVMNLTHGPGPWQMTLFEVNGGSLDPVQTTGFGYVGGNTLVMGFDMTDIVGFGPEFEFGYGYAGHIHDGRFGQCADCPSKISTFPPFPRDEGFPPYTGGPLIKPGFDGHYDVTDVRAIEAPDGFLWFSFQPVEPWGSDGFPTDYFSQFFQFGVTSDGGQTASFFGLEDHKGQFDLFGSGPEGEVPAEFFIMSNGSVVGRSTLTGGDIGDEGLDLIYQGGYTPTVDGTFTSVQRLFEFGPGEFIEDDPLSEDDPFPVFAFTTFEPIPEPTTTTQPATTETTQPLTTETTQAETTATTLPATTTERTEVETELVSITLFGEECWWCWGIIALFAAFLVCVLYVWLKTYEWWTCWLPWFLVIFIWAPFLLAGLWFFRPSWWWVPLLAWFPVIGLYTWYWARRRTWWRPWHLYVVGGYLVALVVGMVVVGAPEWGLLLPLFWVPWVGFYLWFRGLRQPWWRPWMWLAFGGWVAAIFAWLIWLTPFWGGWFPAVFFPALGWWTVARGYDWDLELHRKTCWLVPMGLLPWLGYMTAIYCVTEFYLAL